MMILYTFSGANWGIKGYILIARNMGNMCGIASNAMYPV